MAIVRPFIVAFAALLLLGLTMLHAQSYNWNNVEIGGGGFVTGTIYHPSVAGLVYARTDVGGIYRLDPGATRWQALNDEIGGLNNEFQHLGVLSVGLDPNDGNRVYFTSGQYGGSETWKLFSRFYRSTNRGQTWNYVSLPFKMAGNGEARGTGERIAVNPVNGAIILIGTSNMGLWRSTDSGSTWTRMNNFLPSSANFVLYHPRPAGSTSSNVPVFAAGNTLTGPSLWRSDDNGTTWSSVANQPGLATGAEMMAIQGSFDAAGVFYSTWGDQTGPSNGQTRSQVWKLSADGLTWTLIQPPTGQGGFSGISADPRVAGHVIVSTLHRWWPGDEIYRSTDGGANWTSALRSATRSVGVSPWASTVGPHWITDVDIDPFDSNRAMFNTGYGLYNTSTLSSSGTARTWTFFNQGLEELVPLDLHSPTAGPSLYSAVGDYTGFRHDDISRSPQQGRLAPSNGSNNAITGAELAAEKLLRQNGWDTYASDDAGVTWSKFLTEPSETVNGCGRIVFSSDGLRLLWCPPNAMASYSTNAGASWNSIAQAVSPNSSGVATFNVLAGSFGIAGSTDSSGGNARFNLPSAVAVNASGERLIADGGNHCIRIIRRNAAVATLAGSAGNTGSTDATGSAARFNSPMGITVDASGTIFVADTGNHCIRKITSTGVVTTIAGAAGLSGSTDATGSNARFNRPSGIAVDAAGVLFVTDAGNHCIRKISSTGVVTTWAGSAGVSGTSNGLGSSARFNNPLGICLDTAGNAFVADATNHAIRKITSDGTVTTFAGLAGTSGSTNGTGSAARFNSPNAVACDANGNLYVADTNNQLIRKITAGAVVTSLAGSAGASGAVNGAGTTARFSGPTGIAVDRNGSNYYVADRSNHVIRSGSSFNTLIPLADRVDGQRFYLWDSTLKKMLTSTDGGVTFTTISSNLNSAFAQCLTVPGKNGHIWARAGTSGLYQSKNFGASFSKIASVAEVYQFDFGRAAPSASYPALFIWGKVGTVVGFFRSDDEGATWTRINDALHQFGYINAIAGDPRVYGRVYLGTSGRGVIVGDFATRSTPPAVANALIYDNALQTGWSNLSPSATLLNQSSNLRRGSAAIAIPAGTDQLLSLGCTKRSLLGYHALSFWLNTAAAAPSLQIGISRGGIALDAVPVTIPAASGWQRVELSLSSLGIDQVEDLTGLRIETNSLSGGAADACFIDDIVLIGDLTPVNPNPVSISLSQLSATYDGTAKSVSVSTVPSTAVFVTYNGSPTAPINAGSYAVSVVLDDPVNTGNASGTLVIQPASASITIGNLQVNATGDPQSVTISTVPPLLNTSVTYNGSATPPYRSGAYLVVAQIVDANYTGSANATFTIARNAFSRPLTNWRVITSTTVTGSDTNAPLLNADGGVGSGNTKSNSGASCPFFAAFPAILLDTVGDVIECTGTVRVYNTGLNGNAGQWFRFGLYDQRDPDASIVTNWLGYTAMANSSAASSLYERTSSSSSGDFASSIFGCTPRTPDSSPSYVGANSPAGEVTLNFSQSCTRTAAGVVVRSRVSRPSTNGGADTVYLSSTYTDTTPNNNGVLTSAQSTATTPVYSPRFNQFGIVFSGAAINSTNPSSAQFSQLQLNYTPGIVAVGQSITFQPMSDLRYGAEPLTLTAVASSGLPVSFSVVSGPAQIQGNQLTCTGVGSVTVRASQAGDTFFLPATSVDRSFMIQKGLATLQWGSLQRVYDGTAKAVTLSTTPSGLGHSIIYSGLSTPPNAAGSYSLTATVNDPLYEGSATGTLVIGKALAAVTLGNLAATSDGNAKSASAITNPAGLMVDFTYNGSPTAPTNAGTYAVVATISEANYQGSATGTLVIEPARTKLELWRFQYFSRYDNGAQAANDADADGDGLTNLLEYALGLNPLLAQSLPIEWQKTALALELTYTCKSDDPQLSCTVEWTDDLQAPWSIQDVTSENLSAPTASSVTVRSRVPLSQAGARFARLRVSYQ